MEVPKIRKGWKELNEEVIQTQLCVYCGACGAFCENIRFDPDREVPIEDGSCTTQATCRDGFGTCYNLCPKTGKEYFTTKILDQWVFQETRAGKLLGHHGEIVSVRFVGNAGGAHFTGGGAVTGLLLAALEARLIDGAICAAADERGRPKPVMATTPEDIRASAGTKHTQGPTLSLLGKLIAEDCSDIAVVGTPCQIQALRKMQNHPQFDFETYDLVKYAIGTFCLGASHSAKIGPFLQSHGINPTQIRGTRHHDFQMEVIMPQGRTLVPHNALFGECVRENCRSCSDYTAAFADIAAGMIGSPEGWTTLIVRTRRGQELLDNARRKGMVETQPLPAPALEAVLSLDREGTDWVQIEAITSHAPDTRTFSFRVGRIARAYRPGQFVVMWLPEADFFPMTVSGVRGDVVDVTVQKVGPGTTALFALKEGDELGIRGPYGNGWRTADGRNILVVGGGIGIAALATVVEDLKATGKNVWVAIGARNVASLIFEERLRSLASDCCCTTDDGSAGRKCFVTDAIADILAEQKIDLVLTCGPEVMMKAVYEIACARNIEVQASLERFMKCAVGICGSCCVGEENNIAVCKDGPVFGTAQLQKMPQFGKHEK